MIEYEVRKIRAVDSLTIVKQNYVKAKFNLVILNSQYTLENNSGNEELKKLSLDTKYDSMSLTNQFALAKNKIRNIYGDYELEAGNLILKANDNGIVSYIFDGDKEVTRGSILVKLMKDKKALFGLVKSPPSLIGKIRLGRQQY